jgi:hypothetical protein
MKNYNVSQIKNLILGAKTALIAVPQLSVDSLGSALSLALILKKSNIKVQVFCPHKTDANYSKLSGLDLVSENYNPNNLIISLNYPLEHIENVSYNNDNDRLNLIIKTKCNSPKVNNNQIAINNQSGIADVCFMLGDESGLGENSAIVNNGNWIFISPSNIPKTWAKATLVDQDAPFSEIFSFLIPALGFKLDLDSAKDLLIGLRVATQSFSVNVSPETFEAGALCLRATQPIEDKQPVNNSQQNNSNGNQPFNNPQSNNQSSNNSQPNTNNSQSLNNPSNNNQNNSFDNFTPLESVESKPNNVFNPTSPSSLPTA